MHVNLSRQIGRLRVVGSPLLADIIKRKPEPSGGGDLAPVPFVTFQTTCGQLLTNFFQYNLRRNITV